MGTTVGPAAVVRLGVMATVTDPQGGAWTVRRRWIPHRTGIGLKARFRRRRRARRRDRNRDRWYDGLDIGDGCLDVDGIVIAVGVIVAVLLLVFFGWPLFLLLLDVVWLVVVLVLGVLGRVVLGRPWDVEAVGPDGLRRRWRVKGFRAAGRKAAELAQHVALGAPLRPDEVLPQ